jgi:type IV pilus assembly protein PilO
MAAENPLTKLPLAAQLGLAAGLAAVILGLFWYFYWSPASVEEAKNAKRLEDLRADIRKLEITANKLEEFKREVQQREAKLEQLKQILPPAKETPDLMRKVQYLASSSNLSVTTFDPGPVATKEFYAEYPITLTVQGSYHNLALFFDRVGRIPRLVNANNVRIQSRAKPTAQETISATCIATTYVYVEKAAAPPKPARPAPRK